MQDEVLGVVVDEDMAPLAEGEVVETVKIPPQKYSSRTRAKKTLRRTARWANRWSREFQRMAWTANLTQ